MLTGHLHLQWEAASRTPETDKREWIPNVAILTLKDGVVHMGFLKLEVIKFYGSTGLRVLEGLIRALESLDGVYHDRDFEITCSRDGLHCSYTTTDPAFLSTLRQTLAWICLSSRDDGENHKDQNIVLSTGSWTAADTSSSFHFHLHAVEAPDWQGSGWTKGIKRAVVVCPDPDLMAPVPKTPLLRTVFLWACLLVGECRPMHVENGLIFHGGFTVLIPLEMCQHGNILWEVLIKDDDVLQLSEINSLQTHSWFQTLDLDLLLSCPTLIR